MFTQTAFNLMNLQVPEGYEVRFIAGEGWCPAMRHNFAVGMAMTWGADRLCFMGADHFVDEDCLVKLIHHIDERGYGMACGWVPSRGVCGPNKEAYPYLAFKIIDHSKIDPAIPAVLQYTEDNWIVLGHGAESQEIDIIGTGIMMFKADIVIAMKNPLFYEFIERSPLFNRLPVQDSQFCYRAVVEQGNKCWLDTTIQALHLDVFAIDESFRDRFTDRDGTHWSSLALKATIKSSGGEVDGDVIRVAEPVRSVL